MYKKAWKSAALAQLEDAHFNSARRGSASRGSCTRCAGQLLGLLLSVHGAPKAASLPPHKLRSGKRDHIPQLSASRAFSTSVHERIMKSIVGALQTSFATQTYPNITVATRAPGRTLQRDIERARLFSSTPSANTNKGTNLLPPHSRANQAQADTSTTAKLRPRRRALSYTHAGPKTSLLRIDIANTTLWKSAR